MSAKAILVKAVVSLSVCLSCAGERGWAQDKPVTSPAAKPSVTTGKPTGKTTGTPVPVTGTGKAAGTATSAVTTGKPTTGTTPLTDKAAGVPGAVAGKPVVPALPVGPPPIVIDHLLAAITALAYSPDGKRLALGTYKQVDVYDTTTWQTVAVTTEIEDSVRSLAFSPDGLSLAIGCGLPGIDGLPMTWDMNSASKPVSYPKQKDTIEAIAFRKDGKGLLCGANDNKIRYFGALPGPTGAVLDEHNGRVQAVAFSPKPDYVFISGGYDRIVKVWDQKSMHTVANFDQSEGGVTGLAFINENHFVGSSLDGKLYWWGIGYDTKKNTYGGYHFRTVGAHDGGVFALSISNDSRRFITCGADKAVMIWNTDGGKVREFKDLKTPMYAVALSTDGKIAAAGGREGILYIWDVDGNKLLNNVVPPALPKAAVTKAAGNPTSNPTLKPVSTAPKKN